MSWSNQPIKILKVETKGKPIELGKKFVEDDDWLKGLTVTVQNVSNKAIARIELGFAFMRPEGFSEEISTLFESMIYGQEPSSQASGSELMKHVVPGASVDVKLLEANLPSIKTALKTLGYQEKITHAQLIVSSVTFIDGSEWAGGDTILYPDPANPTRKINPNLPTVEPVPNRPKQPTQSSTRHQPPVSFAKSSFSSVDPKRFKSSRSHHGGLAIPQTRRFPATGFLSLLNILPVAAAEVVVRTNRMFFKTVHWDLLTQG